MLAAMNQENGLPAEVQKFLDTYLPTAAEKAAFLAEYSRLKNEQDRQAFLARYAEEPTDEDLAALRNAGSN